MIEAVLRTKTAIRLFVEHVCLTLTAQVIE